MTQEFVIDERLVDLHLPATDRDGALRHLCRLLAEGGLADDSYAGAVLEREASYPTGLQFEGIAIGLPHAHPAHPPYVPLVPLGPVVLGFSNGVLIGGMPAVLNGALGVSPTCCGVSPYYEVFTGSANVVIEGERAVRMLDLTFHCQAAPLSGRHPRLRRTLHGAQQALHGEHKVEDVADFAEQNAAAAGALHSAQDGPAEREAAVEAVTMARTSELAERAQDQLIEAMSRLMGLDPAAPAGTPGVLIEGAANVLIGGMPMPSGSALVRGLLRLLP